MKISKTLLIAILSLMAITFVACSNTSTKQEAVVTTEPQTEVVTEPQTEAQTEMQTEATTEAKVEETNALPEIKIPKQQIELDEFNFKVNGMDVNNETLKDCQIYKVTIDNILAKDGKRATNKETGEPLVLDFTGYKIVDIISALGIEGKTVYARCSDGYESDAYDLSVNPDYLIAGIEKDKKPAEDGTIYFAPAFESYNSKYARSVVEFIVE